MEGKNGFAQIESEIKRTLIAWWNQASVEVAEDCSDLILYIVSLEVILGWDEAESVTALETLRRA